MVVIGDVFPLFLMVGTCIDYSVMLLLFISPTIGYQGLQMKCDNGNEGNNCRKGELL